MTSNDNVVATRLSALWALIEISIGGLLHALRIPLSGLFVGSMATGCIYLVARTTGSAKSIVRSLAAVSAIKMASTPHASPFSYVAMTVQTACCIPLAGTKGSSKGWTISMFMLASTYSPIQKIILMYVTFGQQGLHTVLMELRDWLAPSLSSSQFIVVPVILWVVSHQVVGFLLAQWLFDWTSAEHGRKELFHEWNAEHMSRWQGNRVSTSRVRQWSWIIAVTVCILALYFFDPYMPEWTLVLWRPLLILFAWHAIVRPLFGIIASNWIKTRINGPVQDVMGEFPRVWSILTFARSKSATIVGWLPRLRTFLRVTVVLSSTPHGDGRYG